MKSEKRREYQRNAYRQYKKRNPISKKIGQYDPSTKLYFYGISSSGKEVWKDKKAIDNKKEKMKSWRKRYYEKCKQLPPTHLNVGDQNPDDPSLYVIYKRGNKIFYGSMEKLLDIKEKNKKLFQKRNAKYKELRKFMDRKYKRGDIHPQTKFVFWQYSYSNKEIWMTKKEFDVKHKTYIECQKVKHKLRMIKRISEKQ